MPSIAELYHSLDSNLPLSNPFLFGGFSIVFGCSSWVSFCCLLHASRRCKGKWGQGYTALSGFTSFGGYVSRLHAWQKETAPFFVPQRTPNANHPPLPSPPLPSPSPGQYFHLLKNIFIFSFIGVTGNLSLRDIFPQQLKALGSQPR